MLKSIIVDDEQKSRESLKILLEEFCKDVTVLELVKSVDEAIEAIAEYNPDLIFLDIQMQQETGFDLLNKLDKIDFDIIFTTAHSEFAIEAIKFSAVDYLLKPIDITELKNAVKRVEKKKAKTDIKEQLETLLHNFKSENSDNFKLAIPSSEGLLFVNIKNILYCEALSNYTKIHMKDGKAHLITRTLKEYEKMLSRYNFLRIHHAFLINTNEIKKYVKGDGGYVVMSNDSSIDVSKRKKEAFLKAMGQM
ncbi:MAG: LytTR family DNA-binding domain-containing protein [Cytophagales bacterium]|nr:LytTR family DNA-binding domain-containing protein [Cytophagales bacterium]